MTVSSTAIHHNDGNGVRLSGGSLGLVAADVHDNDYGVYVDGGTLIISSSELYDNGYYGIKQEVAGDTDITQSYIHNNPYGALVAAGEMDITASVFIDNDYHFLVYGDAANHDFNDNFIYAYPVGSPSWGVYNNTTTDVDATETFWGSDVGPNGCDEENEIFCSASTTNYVTASPRREVVGRWSARDFNINWDGGSALGDYFTDAQFMWDSTTESMGLVSISDTSTVSNVSMTIEDGSLTPGIWGYTDLYRSATDTITFDMAQINAFGLSNPSYATTSKKWIAAHELGHTLGIGHVDGDNIMRDGFAPIKTASFGGNDYDEYHFIWTTMQWAIPWLWPM